MCNPSIGAAQLWIYRCLKSRWFLFSAAGFHDFSPDSSAVGPVTGHAGAGQQGGHWLVKQEVVSDQLLLLGVSHAVEGVVLSLELSIQAGQS